MWQWRQWAKSWGEGQCDKGTNEKYLGGEKCDKDSNNRTNRGRGQGLPRFFWCPLFLFFDKFTSLVNYWHLCHIHPPQRFCSRFTLVGYLGFKLGWVVSTHENFRGTKCIFKFLEEANLLFFNSIQWKYQKRATFNEYTPRKIFMFKI